MQELRSDEAAEDSGPRNKRGRNEQNIATDRVGHRSGNGGKKDRDERGGLRHLLRKRQPQGEERDNYDPAAHTQQAREQPGGEPYNKEPRYGLLRLLRSAQALITPGIRKLFAARDRRSEERRVGKECRGRGG